MNYAQLLHDKISLRIGYLEENEKENNESQLDKQGNPVSISGNHDEPYKQVAADLEALRLIVETKKPLVVLEFGSGWSTLVICQALENLRGAHKTIPFSVQRHTHAPFSLTTLDESAHWLEVAKTRLPDSFMQHVEFVHSPVVQRLVGQVVTLSYSTIPMVKPDFIYLDGPSQFAVSEDPDSPLVFGTNRPWFPPIASDLLRLEWLLDPGAVILIDGRGQNVEFLVRHLERDWAVTRFQNLDLTLMTLISPSIGDHNRKKLIWELGE